jgi:hypothetical protein
LIYRLFGAIWVQFSANRAEFMETRDIMDKIPLTGWHNGKEDPCGHYGPFDTTFGHRAS